VPWALRLATLFAGRRLDEEGFGDCVTECISAGQQSSLRLRRGAARRGAAYFSQSASTLKAGDTGLTLNFGNA